MNISGKITRTAVSLLASAGIISGLSACGAEDIEKASVIPHGTSDTFASLGKQGISQSIDRDGRAFYIQQDGHDVVDVYSEPAPLEAMNRPSSIFLYLTTANPSDFPRPPFTWQKDFESGSLLAQNPLDMHSSGARNMPLHMADERVRDYRLIIRDYGEPRLCRKDFPSAANSTRLFAGLQTECEDVYDLFEADAPETEEVKYILGFHHDLHQS